ncbi:MAG: type II toxin-antitoxin system VapC family toxin [Burkholderiales bacterium]
MARVLLDTGPLVALFKRNDASHRRAAAWFARNRAALVTTHAVLTEAWHLISPPARGRLMAFAAEALIVPELPADAIPRLTRLLATYADTPMDYADATLVLLAHHLGELRVATIDLGDFGVYRTEGKKALRVVF